MAIISIVNNIIAYIIIKKLIYYVNFYIISIL